MMVVGIPREENQIVEAVWGFRWAPVRDREAECARIEGRHSVKVSNIETHVAKLEIRLCLRSGG